MVRRKIPLSKGLPTAGQDPGETTHATWRMVCVSLLKLAKNGDHQTIKKAYQFPDRPFVEVRLGQKHTELYSV